MEMTDIHSCSYYCNRPECIKAQRDELRSRLEQPEPDVPTTRFGNMGPVGWLEPPDGVFRANPLYKIKFPSKLLSWQVPLYTAPQQRTWVDVRDEEIKILWIQNRTALPRYLCFAKALLARAKEENT